MTPKKIFTTVTSMNPRPRKELDTSTYEGRFAARLKMLRQRAGLTVQQVADELGVTLKMVYAYENGTYMPSVAVYPILAKLYNLKKTNALLPEK